MNILAMRFLVFALVAIGGAAQGQGVELTPWLAGAAGGAFEDQSGGDLDVGDTGFVALSVNMDSRQGGQYELYYARQDASLETGGFLASAPTIDLDIEYYQFGGTIAFDIDEVFRPYAVFTIGASRFTPGAPELNDETFFAATLGGGVRFDLSKHIVAKLEARALMNLIDGESEIFCESGGGQAQCAIGVGGDFLVQWSASAGLAYRF